MTDLVKPLEKPRWATDVTADVITPSIGKQDVGWIVEMPPHDYFNWLHLWTYNWLQYFEAKSDTDFGGSAEATLTIASGAITPTVASNIIDTEAAAATDDLTNIVTTNLQDGRVIIIRSANAGRVITIKHNAGGAGEITLIDEVDLVLSNPLDAVILKRVGADWHQIVKGTSKRWNTYGVNAVFSGYLSAPLVKTLAIQPTSAADVNFNIDAGTSVGKYNNSGEFFFGPSNYSGGTVATFNGVANSTVQFGTSTGVGQIGRDINSMYIVQNATGYNGINYAESKAATRIQLIGSASTSTFNVDMAVIGTAGAPITWVNKISCNATGNTTFTNSSGETLILKRISGAGGSIDFWDSTARTFLISTNIGGGGTFYNAAMAAIFTWTNAGSFTIGPTGYTGVHTNNGNFLINSITGNSLAINKTGGGACMFQDASVNAILLEGATANGFQVYNNAFSVGFRMTQTTDCILGANSYAGSHKCNGYISLNAGGTSGSASGEHPYIAFKRITGILTASVGSHNIAHGIADGSKIISVTGKLSGTAISGSETSSSLKGYISGINTDVGNITIYNSLGATQGYDLLIIYYI
jgi:hypothetical protein